MNHTNPHIGTTFDDFLLEQGIKEEVDNVAAKRAIALQLQEFMRDQKITKSQMAAKLGTSRPQLDRILDPNNDSVTLGTLSRAASVIGKKLKIEFA